MISTKVYKLTLFGDTIIDFRKKHDKPFKLLKSIDVLPKEKMAYIHRYFSRVISFIFMSSFWKYICI